MVSIQVLGKGMIAPRKKPFEADLKLIYLILQSGTFKVNMVNPMTGAMVPVNFSNVDRMYKVWNNYKPEKQEVKTEATPMIAPVVPESSPAVNAIVESAFEKVEEKTESNDESNEKHGKKNKYNNGKYKPITNEESKE